MSALLELLNEIRRTAELSWLTPSQREAFDALASRGRSLSPAVLLGPPGSGKTLIGWLLRRHLSFGHVGHPESIPLSTEGTRGIVIDNADLSGLGARSVLGQATLKGWTTAIVLARSIGSEGLPTFRLTPPSEAEVRLCMSSLPVLLPYEAVPGERDLWKAVRRRLADLTVEDLNER
jgi:hypothetical protein